MSKKLLVMTEEKWQRFAPPEQDRSNTYIKVSEFRAAMTEVDMYDTAYEFVRTVPATVSTLRHIYINDFVVWLLAHIEEGK